MALLLSIFLPKEGQQVPEQIQPFAILEADGGGYEVSGTLAL